MQPARHAIDFGPTQMIVVEVEHTLSVATPARKHPARDQLAIGARVAQRFVMQAQVVCACVIGFWQTSMSMRAHMIVENRLAEAT